MRAHCPCASCRVGLRVREHERPAGDPFRELGAGTAAVTHEEVDADRQVARCRVRALRPDELRERRLPVQEDRPVRGRHLHRPGQARSGQDEFRDARGSAFVGGGDRELVRVVEPETGQRGLMLGGRARRRGPDHGRVEPVGDPRRRRHARSPRDRCRERRQRRRVHVLDLGWRPDGCCRRGRRRRVRRSRGRRRGRDAGQREEPQVAHVGRVEADRGCLACGSRCVASSDRLALARGERSQAWGRLAAGVEACRVYDPPPARRREGEGRRRPACRALRRGRCRS